MNYLSYKLTCKYVRILNDNNDEHDEHVCSISVYIHMFVYMYVSA